VSFVPGRIRLEPYDPGWASRFEAERDLLERLLAAWLVGRVEHVGSTAVPGLEAKPILDMIAPVRSLPEAAEAVQPLAAAGYAAGEHRPAEAHYFFKPAVEHWWQRTHQLHLTEPTTELWRGRIGFRDALRAREDFRARYVELKRQLAQAHVDDIEAYAGAKRDFVSEVLASPEAVSQSSCRHT
jgi:GrpB-like predicted nucleotidyltransferase (UPF0157 family)